MFYRVTKYNFADERFDEMLTWTETIRADVEAIDGLHYVDMFRSAPGEGMIVAAYENEASFTAASETVSAVLGGMAEFLSSQPHTHAGTVDVSFGR